ncbi:hypothetical protein BV20DRAFT_965144 [Pilatotrama ljubarskyi]|nr:hypothetical protein BV20DRAFT_965144 [Pilatotrama ljubarskyi]
MPSTRQTQTAHAWPTRPPPFFPTHSNISHHKTAWASSPQPAFPLLLSPLLAVLSFSVTAPAMASSSVSPHSAVHANIPTLKQYFSPTVFHDVGSQSRASSRPSSSSSSASYASPASATGTDSSPASSYTSPSRSWTSAASSSPLCDETCRLGRSRPLPTPPATPLNARSSFPPRPLPHPPLARSNSDIHPGYRSNPLPTPPTVPAPPRVSATASGSALAPQSRRPIIPERDESAISVTAVASVSASTSHPGRPSIQLSIPGSPPKDSRPPRLAIPTPLSPIVLNFSGPDELRKRREDELCRRMKDLGFVEATPPPPPPKGTGAPGKVASHPGRHAPTFSISCVGSDDDKDVVLLEDLQSDSESGHPPMRSGSRAAMLTLFAGVEEEAGLPSPRAMAPTNEALKEVQVEVITKKAAARTKRRFSRKWVREKSGKRWTEKDFSEILSELRRLR